MKVFYWAPFFTEIATISAVINSARSLVKYPKNNKYSVMGITAMGGADQHSFTFSKPDTNICPKEPCYLKNEWVGNNKIISETIGEPFNNSHNAILECKKNPNCIGINFWPYGINFDNDGEYYLKKNDSNLTIEKSFSGKTKVWYNKAVTLEPKVN